MVVSQSFFPDRPGLALQGDIGLWNGSVGEGRVKICSSRLILEPQKGGGSRALELRSVALIKILHLVS